MCLKNISAGAQFPGRREDFASDAAWQQWKMTETSTIQQMVVMMVKHNPELARSTAAERNSVASSYSASNLQRTNSNYSDFNSPHHLGGNRRSLYDLNGNDDPIGEYGEYNTHGDAPAAYSQDDDLPVGHNFTFIPPNPILYILNLQHKQQYSTIKARARRIS